LQSEISGTDVNAREARLQKSGVLSDLSSVRKAYHTSLALQDAFAERLIGSIRRECLNHIIVFGEAHPRRT
jgi:hypothetical protein